MFLILNYYFSRLRSKEANNSRFYFPGLMEPQLKQEFRNKFCFSKNFSSNKVLGYPKNIAEYIDKYSDRNVKHKRFEWANMTKDEVLDQKLKETNKIAIDQLTDTKNAWSLSGHAPEKKKEGEELSESSLIALSPYETDENNDNKKEGDGSNDYKKRWWWK